MTAKAILICLLFSMGCLQAQYLHYPTTGVPKKPNGTPNLEAPTPRLSDHHPDFSGVWATVDRRPCPKTGCADMPIGDQFLNIGTGIQGGLPFQPWAAELYKKRAADFGKDDPTSRCMPGSTVQMLISAFLRKIIQVPGLMVMLYENGATYRQIFTDNRPLPVDPEPYWFGYSSAKWEGDTLVVQTAGFRDGLWLDRNGTPMTDAAKMTERFRRPNYGNLEIDVTIDDPKAYTAPFTVKIRHQIALDTELFDSPCNENEKDMPHMIGK